MKVKLTNYRKTIIKILSCFFVIFPWITYLSIMEYNDAEMLVFAGQSGFTLDFFLKSKEVVLLVSVVGMLFLYVTELCLTPKKDKVMPFVKGNHKWLFITSGVFLVFTILSTLLSEQKKNALWGSPTECEGLWIFIAYIVLTFAVTGFSTFVVANTEADGTGDTDPVGVLVAVIAMKKNL